MNDQFFLFAKYFIDRWAKSLYNDIRSFVLCIINHILHLLTILYIPTNKVSLFHYCSDYELNNLVSKTLTIIKQDLIGSLVRKV